MDRALRERVMSRRIIEQFVSDLNDPAGWRQACQDATLLVALRYAGVSIKALCVIWLVAYVFGTAGQRIAVTIKSRWRGRQSVLSGDKP